MLSKLYAKYVLENTSKNTSKIKNKEVCNLQDAKRIAILFNGTKVKNIKLVKHFITKFAKGKQMVTVLGYVDRDHKSFDHMSVLHFDFFSKRELSWYGKPKGMVIRNFLNEEFDILIDLSLKDFYPLKYLSVASKAKYKVGRYREDISIFDLSIDYKDNRNLAVLIDKISQHLIS